MEPLQIDTQIRLFWWRLVQQRTPPRGNFGDELTPLLIREIYGYDCIWAPADQCDMAGAGSIIEMLTATKGSNKPTLWGSGFMRPKDVLPESQSTINQPAQYDYNLAALRGIHTQAKLQSERTDKIDNIALGDPGLLANLLLESRPKKKYKLGIVPHMIDAGLPEVDSMRNKRGVKIINVRNDPKKIIREMSQCHVIISSSLHGLIVSDSLEIPNAHVNLSAARSIGGSQKFHDYYSIFKGKSRYSMVDKSLIKLRDVDSIIKTVEDTYIPAVNLKQIQRDLIESFPF